MKTITTLLLAASVALVGCHKKETPTTTAASAGQTFADNAKATADQVADHTRDAAQNVKASVSEHINEWHLSSNDIRDELQRTGRVVREKSAATGNRVGEAIDNARIVTAVNAKFIADPDLKARKINVDAADGVVTLSGSVDSFDLIGRAAALTLETDGVRQVVSLLTVRHN